MSLFVDSLDSLIERATLLPDLLASIQRDLEQPPTNEQLRETRDSYMEWYTNCAILLPSDVEESFEAHFSRAFHSIKWYLYNANQLRWYDDEDGQYPHWHYPYADIEQSLSEQRYTLIRYKKQVINEVRTSAKEYSANSYDPERGRLLSRIQVEQASLYDLMLEFSHLPNVAMNLAQQIGSTDLRLSNDEQIDGFAYRVERLSEVLDQTLPDDGMLDSTDKGIEDQLRGSISKLKTMTLKMATKLYNEATTVLDLGPIPEVRISGLTLPDGYGHLANDCRKFLREHPDYDRNVFIMTKFGDDRPSKLLDAEIRSVVGEYGMKALRADDKNYSADRTLWNNVCVYMLCSRFGVAILDDRNADEFNANVALEYGFMRALNRQTLLLADKGFSNLKSDIIGTLRERFDIADIEQTVRPALERWLRDVDMPKALSRVSEDGIDRPTYLKTSAT